MINKPLDLKNFRRLVQSSLLRPPLMASPAATAKITLTYPLYAADFDPHNSSYLLVGGGGGESRSGVGNKIVRAKFPTVRFCSLILALDSHRRLSKTESR